MMTIIPRSPVIASASDPVVIVSAARTLLGRFMGDLSPFSAHSPGSHVIGAAIEQENWHRSGSAKKGRVMSGPLSDRAFDILEAPKPSPLIAVLGNNGPVAQMDRATVS